ncbi:type VI secretion system ATPase TssH [Enterobacteriaceae bacterium 4M9]|nr:type VI secretion system ATPase TssH [Enterobacteriaceae bacterium 4M9]
MTITRESLFGRLDITLFSSIESATTLCKLRGNSYVELVHWINQLWNQEDNDVKHIVRHFHIDVEKLERGLSQALLRLPAGATSISDFSYHIELAIERAWIHASLEHQENHIRSGHLIQAILMNTELRRIITALCEDFNGIDLNELSRDLNFITRGSPEAEQIANAPSQVNAGALPGEVNGAMKASHNSSLSQFTTDLTALAREGKMDPISGRGQEITTMIDILLRRRQNNPLLAGDAGVGKTAVVEGLAQAIAGGDVPPALQQVRLLALDVIALSAGASMKGEFEARLKAVLDEASGSDQPVILFIDEVHTLVGAGGNAGTGDAANLLKPALARGQIRCIGATTWSEFKRHIEKDPALTRRFQLLQIEEPDEDSATAMLRRLVPVLEKHHDVWITSEALKAAVKLSHRYIPARQLPDKAISLLDTACARVSVAKFAQPDELQRLSWQREAAEAELIAEEKACQLGQSDLAKIEHLRQKIEQLSFKTESLNLNWQSQRDCVTRITDSRQKILQLFDAGSVQEMELAQARHELDLNEQLLRELSEGNALVQPEVNTEVIARIVSDWTGVPIGEMLKDEVRTLKELPARLNTRIIGQSEALEQLSENILTARSGLADPRKPQGVFMLVGPSGVGKTETALAIAANIYGGEENLITINMSEYQEPHSVSSLKGSPPGYVGYGEGGVLTEAVRRKPYSVILLDEIEKAHSDIHELFYQVFDKGQMEDGEGRFIDFKNTIILLTSNVGSELINTLFLDEETAPDTTALLTAIQPELLKAFPAAFLGRVTILPYRPLPEASLKDIANIHLQRVQLRMQEQHGCELRWNESVITHVVGQCPVAETGARMIIRYIEKNITSLLGRYVFDNDKTLQSRVIMLDVKDGLFFIDEYKEVERI